jgi:hypothetical protein
MLLLWPASQARAVILLGGNNSANTTDPGSALPWASVAKLTNSTGTTVAPSAVYLGNGYMLTANHVDMTGLGYVQFEPSGPTYAIDNTYTPYQVVPGVDMKIFKLQSLPSVTAVTLLTLPIEQVAPAYQVGWGVGRDPGESIGDTSVLWGDSTTATKRWGANVLRAVGTDPYDTLYTILGSDSGTPAGLGANEAAATVNDSGSGLFQNIGGIWYLVGLTTGVETDGTSNFGNDTTSDPRGDANAFVRISSYASAINAAVVPEPSTYALFALGLGMVGLHLRRTRVAR